jgi:hypothetical protein
MNRSDTFDQVWSQSLRTPNCLSKSFKISKSSVVEHKEQKSISLALSNQVIENSTAFEKMRQTLLSTISENKQKLEASLKKNQELKAELENLSKPRPAKHKSFSKPEAISGQALNYYKNKLESIEKLAEEQRLYFQSAIKTEEEEILKLSKLANKDDQSLSFSITLNK